MNLTMSDLGSDVWCLDVSGSLSPADLSPFDAAIGALPASARCVVLKGDKRMFNSGASRAALIEMQPSIAECGAEFARLLLNIPVPTIAAMAGHAIGGGLLLGLWCDHFLFAEDRLYGANFTALGFTPGMGATVALEDALGASLAREMLYTGRLLTGCELKERGAPIPYVLRRDQVEARAFSLAQDLAFANAESVRLLRKTVTDRRRSRLDAAVRDEARMHIEVFRSPGTLARIADQLPPC